LNEWIKQNDKLSVSGALSCIDPICGLPDSKNWSHPLAHWIWYEATKLGLVSSVYYIRQVNGVKLADILFLLLSVCVSVCLCVCVCAHSALSSAVCVPPTTHQHSAISLMQPISLPNPCPLGGYLHSLSAFCSYVMLSFGLLVRVWF